MRGYNLSDKPNGWRSYDTDLVIWGERDSYLGSELAEPESRWVPNLRMERLPESAHWVQLDAPERVNELLIGFLSEDSSA